MRPGGSHDCAAAGVVPGVAVEVGDGGAGGLAEEDAGGVIPNIGAEAHGAAEDIAWTAIISFILYLSKSMIAALGGYLFCASLTGALAQFYPKSLWLQHFTMSFDFETLQSNGVTLRIILIALVLGTIFTVASLYTFHKKDL